MSSNKIKIAVFSAIGVICAVGLGIGVPSKMPETPKPSVPKVQPVLQSKVVQATNTSQQGDSIASKVITLKGKKNQLSTNVSNHITIYRSMVNEAKVIKQLDSIFNKCVSKNEVSTGISHEEKNSLQSNYDIVKDDMEKYLGIQKKVDGDLKDKESKADNDKDSEEKYQAFQKAFDEAEKEYVGVSEKKSVELLYRSYKSVYDKLKIRNNQCILKDVIKINDKYGQQDLYS